MLQEMQGVRQVAGEPRRRWFADSFFDLIVWYQDDGEPWGFQLCYAKGRDEHAMTWTRSAGYAHERVDSGELQPGKHKSTPVLLADGAFDWQQVAAAFLQQSGEIEETIAGFVYERIVAYGQDTGRTSAPGS